MAPRTKHNPLRMHSQGPAGERGYVLLVFTLFAVFLVVAVYTILPKYVFEGQRQKEDELIFRGQQYTRAIQLFVRKNGRYPLSLDELQSTNGVRFLRQLYPDPMTKDGEWRLIHVGPGPVFLDALNPPAQPTNATAGGNQGSRGPFQIGNQNGNSGGAAGGNNGSNGNNGTSGISGFTIGNAGSGSNGNNGSGTGTSGSGNSGTGGFSIGGNNGSQSNSNSQTVGSGGAIAGVASKDEDEGIKVLNGFHHYNEWEFIFNYLSDPIAARRMAGAAGGTVPGNGGNPANPGGNGANPGPGGNGNSGNGGPGTITIGGATGGGTVPATGPH